ncbi:MAG TPA: protein kinase [Pirellulaceae bacterium]|nr:protein kinase [Pirellulaceae bacterium]
MSVPSQSEESIFAEALQRTAPHERVAFVTGACAGDEPLRRRVLELLAAHDEAVGPLDAPPTWELALERPGTLVGRYKLLQMLGEGGMGFVYLAEQTQPVERRVALKIIKPGMDSRQVIARFEAERQALSLMDHPNIAKVLDGGATDSGRPYFVMELVKGQPITEYCDEKHLTTRQRLELFLPVCQAIEHAHQKGIIHRDIKPSNVLVAEYDKQAVPKVIDFGVAKAIGQSLTDKTMFTGLGQIVGTLEYMSPEQAKVNQLDIDTRSDIYSLGVLLYELLTGSTPFDKQRLRSAGLDEVLRIIREEEPPRPSTRLSQSGEALPSISAQRQTEPSRLSRLIRGDLDWIVMKALEKNRSRRYETASSLARDLERNLNDEPVLARPPTARYRLQKFVRRNRGAVLAAAAVGVILLAATAGVAGAVAWAASDRAARQSLADTGAGQALGEARGYLQDRDWRQARLALDRADHYGLGTRRADLLQLASDLRADLDLVNRLERNRGGLAARTADGMELDFGPTNTAYAAAFGGIDVDPFQHSPAEAGRRIRTRSVPVQLAAAIDDWATVRRFEKDEPGCQRLLETAREADPDPWRNKLRDAIARQDRAALEALALESEVRNQPAVSRALLGKALIDARSFQAAVATLEDARWQHPGDFWITYHLGHACQPAGRLPDAIRYITAASALAGDNEMVDLKLAFLLTSQKSHQEAVVAVRRVLRSHPQMYGAHDLLWQNLQALDDKVGALSAREEAFRLAPNTYKAGHVFALCNVYIERREFERVAALYAQAMELSIETPAHPAGGLFNSLRQRMSDKAWSWVHPYDPTTNDPPRGIEWATRLSTTAPSSIRLSIVEQARWSEVARQQPLTLGVAHYRMGQWEQAIALLRTPDSASQHRLLRDFYLAMALNKTGRVEEGQKGFDLAVRSIQGSHTRFRELWPLVAEAASVVDRPYPPTLRDPPSDAVLAPGPTLLTPADAADVVPGMLVAGTNNWRCHYSWNPVPGATNYHVQVRAAHESLATVSDSSLHLYPFYNIVTFVPNVGPKNVQPSWKWRVRALVNDVWTDWSEERTIWLEAPLGNDALKSDQRGSLED